MMSLHDNNEPAIDTPRDDSEYPPCSMCRGCSQSGTTPRGFGEYGKGCSVFDPKQ